MRALRVCTDTKAAAPASAKCVERVAPIFGMARDKCLPKLQDEFQCEKHPHENPICCEMIIKDPCEQPAEA